MIRSMINTFTNNKDDKDDNINDNNLNDTMRKARLMVNDWKVDMYSNNPHLYNIPEERIQRKYDEFMKQLINENNKDK